MGVSDKPRRLKEGIIRLSSTGIGGWPQTNKLTVRGNGHAVKRDDFILHTPPATGALQK